MEAAVCLLSADEILSMSTEKRSHIPGIGSS
jgi:hypothetical protein